jgi:hypothetical protein
MIEDVSDQPVDDFTMTWLQENGARQCVECGAWTVNEEGVNTNICACGYCYCWDCDDNAFHCPCQHSDFFDPLSGGEFYVNRNADNHVTDEEKTKFLTSLHEYRHHVNQASEVTEEEASQVMEEPCEVFIGSIFDHEEPIEADVVALFDWSCDNCISSMPVIHWYRNTHKPIVRCVTC